MKQLNPIGQRLSDALSSSAEKVASLVKLRQKSEKVHIVGAGRTITSAYEQLRNAAEYTEEHLLLQRAIRRFYRRLFLSRDLDRIKLGGEELAVELTLAGYVKNDMIPVDVVESINELSEIYYTAQLNLVKQKAGFQATDAWTIDVIAVEVEYLLNPHEKRAAFTQTAFDYFYTTLVESQQDIVKEKDFEIALFVAVHRALLKSDTAIIREALLKRYQQSPLHFTDYININKKIDTVLESLLVEKLFRLVNRQGAHLRVLFRMVEDDISIAPLLLKEPSFLQAYRSQVEVEYSQTSKKIKRGVVKSVAFLFITKVVIGLAIEIPYDHFAHGSIAWLPLTINLLFPPLYMILLSLTMTMPSSANTNALVDRIDEALYVQGKSIQLLRRTKNTLNTTFNVLYACFFIIVFGGVAWLLWMYLGFTWLHLIIFFLFLSTASFLGFRLSRMVREIEALDSRQDGLVLLRDFLYMPFVVVGRWISERYAKVNIIAMILDMVIELPLKTVLRLIRQWGAFISDKKDAL
jgi:hypothetical protein